MRQDFTARLASLLALFIFVSWEAMAVQPTPRVISGIIGSNSSPGAEFSISVPGPVYLYGNPTVGSSAITFGGQNISVVTTGTLYMRTGKVAPIEGETNKLLSVWARSVQLNQSTPTAAVNGETLGSIFASGADKCSDANCSSVYTPTIDYQNLNILGPEETSAFVLNSQLLGPNLNGQKVHLGPMKVSGLIAVAGFTPWKNVYSNTEMSGFKVTLEYPLAMKDNPPLSMTSGTFDVGALTYTTIMVSHDYTEADAALQFVGAGGEGNGEEPEPDP